ncbi:MAG TPA: carbamoyltransferase C-terminal domain-containing protein [Candidatus Aquilonibacter sp.]|nr:carbamoyltransferase C-terminal domain-containing protein [Candidatus Aquilonibacter sp.]
MNVLGINAVFHDSSAALVQNGRIVAAAEEERFSRRKHGKPCVPFSAWELPVQSAAWALDDAGLRTDDVDAVAYSYDPDLAPAVVGDDITQSEWEGLRTLFARRFPNFLKTALPGIERARVEFVPHHVAHAASAYLAAPFDRCAVLVLDGRGESSSGLLGVARKGALEILATRTLPHSLGLLYEELTAHLGFHRSSDEYKVMGLAGYGRPRFINRLRELVRVDGPLFTVGPVDLSEFAPPRLDGQAFESEHADLACSVQQRLEEVLLELAGWLARETGETNIAMAGGVALNCVANARLAAEGPFERVWVQPAAGDAGTALGAALYVAHKYGDRVEPMHTAALGRAWDDAQIERWLQTARIPYTRSADIAREVARTIADDGIVAWFQGRSEFGPRALGHRSLLANPRYARNLERLNDVKGREQFRPVAPMVLEERAPEIFIGQLPSPFMLFTHSVREEWRERIAAAVHVDGSARIQTVNRDEEPLVARMLDEVERLTGTPVVINTSLNTAGRPMVDDVRDALECFGSAPIDLLAIGSFAIRRPEAFAGARERELTATP